MNSTEKELHGYIAGTENMSGFDSYDSFEGDMSYFDDEDGSYFDDGDDMSYATGSPAQNQAVSDPYVVQYENTTAGDLTAVIFGYNDYFGASNYGNPVGVTVTNLQGGTYGRLMAQSNNKNFKLGKWRFQSATPAQLQQTMQVTHVDANGKEYRTPVNLSIMRDAYQNQSDVIDLTKLVTVDGNTFITFTLKANAVVTISMFPVAIMSSKAQLNGSGGLVRARAPRLSGKNVAPVIIQTSQDVRGITKG